MVGTQEAANTQIVTDAYAAFGRGDIKSVLDALSDDIVWQGVKGAGKQVPMSGERRGKAAVGDFFNQVGAHITFSKFEPREFVAQGDKVVAIGHYTGRHPPRNRSTLISRWCSRCAAERLCCFRNIWTAARSTRRSNESAQPREAHRNLFRRRAGGLGRRGAAVAIRRRHMILPRQFVIHDLGVDAKGRLDAAIALLEPSAEVVDGRFGIDTDRTRVLAHAAARVDASGPSREIVALESRPERH